MFRSHRTVLAFVFMISALLMCRAPARAQTPPAQTPPAQPTVKRDIARPIQSVEGKEIYREYCAACHGVEGKGDGPAAPAMKVRPSDLTSYAQRHGGTFSEMNLRTVIEGQDDLPAHGSRDMPIWGDVFRALTHDRELREMRMKNLIEHLRGMQGK